ncbi:outer membrane protein assembly factor BamA [Candidatus Pelagibacter sp.]|uniref:outer membrane protein assembly factor BamA n=1 Tax=Candidatus Pelagibacter sp. TaxID=2024849 RepID=UPI003F87BC9C
MFKKINLFVIIIFLYFGFTSNLKSFEEIIINGNDRISKQTIIMFSGVERIEKRENININKILKNLYETNFFENVSVFLDGKKLKIDVVEFPIIEKIEFDGVKAKKIKKQLSESIKLKNRSSYNEILVSEDISSIKFQLRKIGYYFSSVDAVIEKLENKRINLTYKIELGNKAKIKKITFIGDKIFKDGKLKGIIVSEEYKFWKFISGRKFLSEDVIQFDKRLLKNFYLNKGFYNVEINSSFAKLVNDDEFELIYNINPKKKIYFNNLKINLPDDFDKTNFEELTTFLISLKGKPYSLNSVEKILSNIDNITIQEEYKSVKATISENIIKDKLDINFNIQEADKFFVERINIYGNNITRESVIRNQLEIDEGDPYNEILQSKSENNLKSLNFFRKVSSETIDGTAKNSKIINITVDEKPTGEIMAGAGLGNEGGTFTVGVKENNYLGKGLAVEANGTVTPETFKGKLSVIDPNYKNSDKSMFFNVQAIEIDRITDFGYKANKTGFELGTDFEYLEDLNLALSTRSFVEKIETDSTASARQQKQEGNYWDTFLKFRVNYDKRNQKFRPSDGFVSNLSFDLPIISDTNTLTNSYTYKVFTDLYENNITSMSFYIEAANSITGDDIKLSERLFIPSRRLRGFESGKIGPKDGNDFIGGNFATAINFNSTLPVIFENAQNLDASLFVDIANLWGVDYDSSIDDSNKVRSSIGIGIDWFSVVGPINFSFTETLSKKSSDITESFRFNIGTTF